MGLDFRHPPTKKVRWWLRSSTLQVYHAGTRWVDAIDDTTVSGGAGGTTFLLYHIPRRIQQDGIITQCWVWVKAHSGAAWKLKVFRPNGANYDFISECSFTPAADGFVLYTLEMPLQSQPGDCLAVYLPSAGDTLSCTTYAGNRTYSAAGDIQTTDAFVAAVAGLTMNLGALGPPPFLVVCGDSIAEGHNVNPLWHSRFGGGPMGRLPSEFMHQMRNLFMDRLEYQNWSQGSQTYSVVNTTLFAQAYTSYALQARAWLMAAGLNDISTGRAWADVDTDLDAIRARCVSGDLWISEILPWTAGNDVEAATIRTWNANLAAWCAANNAHLVLCHDRMGQIRATTGFLDDLLTAYDFDGTHLTQAGVNAYAQIVFESMDSFYR